MKRKIIRIVILSISSLMVAVSLFFNITLGISTNFKLSKKDNYDDRYEIYNKTINELYLSEVGDGITIRMFKNSSSTEDGSYIEEISHCEFDKMYIVSNCSMIGTVYNSDMSILRTSYFPGDGYKYVQQGETKSKSLYSNNSLLSYAYRQFYNYFYAYASLIVLEENITFTTTLDWDLNNYHVNKVYKATYDVLGDGSSISKLDLTVNENDIITNISIDDSVSFGMKYENKGLTFPDLTGFEI